MKHYSMITAITYTASMATAFQFHPSQLLQSRCTTLGSSRSPIGEVSRFVNKEGEEYPLPSNPKGVIFDMDGTLIQHSINFAEMRRRIYEVADADPIGKDLERDCVLALANKLSVEGQDKANEIFADIERQALENMKLMPGGADLLSFLKENGIKKAVLTRNREKNAWHMQQLYLQEIQQDDGILFHPVVARDTLDSVGKQPLKAKPNPDGVLYVCSMWNCEPSEVIMVGDSVNDDMTAANRAGCGGAVLLTQPDGSSLDTDSGYEVGCSEEEILERKPSLCVESLTELKLYLQVLLKDQRKLKGANGDFVYSVEGYSIDIPSIGAKLV